VKRIDLRFLVAAVLILGTAWLLHARETFEVIPPHQPLAEFPAQIGSWSGVDVPIDNETREVLGSGEFLLRHYSGADAEPNIDLFIAYFPSQRTGDTLHSPKNCLPGSGWSELSKDHTTLSLPDGTYFPANKYVIAKGSEHQLVLYWYLSQGQAQASEYSNKVTMVLNSMRKNRSDGSLIRISTPLEPGETDEAALQRLTPFVDAVIPRLNAYIPN
jgi:EpsI family protein